MISLLADYQLDIMLALAGATGVTAIYTIITNVLTSARKVALVALQITAMILLLADRCAYIFRGDESITGFYMVRVSNFLVFFMLLLIIAGVNVYIEDLVMHEGEALRVPKRLIFNDILALLGMIMIIVSQFTGFYYTFDSTNHYVRGSGFVISYLIPLVIPVIQFGIVIKYFKKLGRGIGISLIIFLVMPVIASVMQFFFYGLSLTNIVVAVDVLILFVFALTDINNKVEHSHQIEIDNLLEEHRATKHLFDQTATAFVAALDAKDEYAKGHSGRVANYAREIARMSGKDEEECDEVYYAALLHDVGTIGVPDSIIGKDTALSDEEYALVKKKPELAAEILSSIKEYPFLMQGARYSCERYDGKGYPEGLKGEEIPELARIVAVADAYDNMRMKKRYREPLPLPVVKEEIIRESGAQFDPAFADIVVKMIDSELSEEKINDYDEKDFVIEREYRIRKYREAITRGIMIDGNVTDISMKCSPIREEFGDFSMPSVIVFSSYDGRVHTNDKAIRTYRYLEYGEIWFDGHSITTGARNMEVNVVEHDVSGKRSDEEEYGLCAYRYQDHMKLKLTGPYYDIEVVIALLDGSKPVYLGITGEDCVLSNVRIVRSDKVVKGDEIPRIADEVSYTGRLESDIPNVQVDQRRSASSKGIAIRDDMRIDFHTMSLPSAELVWNCPYIVIYHSNDSDVNGAGYREYALIKLNGENDYDDTLADSRFVMNKDDDFKGWDSWKETNKKGMECEVLFKRKGSRITVYTTNLGVTLENTITVNDGMTEIYAALTGDRVALTDIRVL
ncbi:MAG: HD domain-containing protein [Lachnospiraceae bacterium]|nr:HD domain-containing protein [Lachnospiraceae bacterium]